MKKYQLYGIGAALVDTEIEVRDGDLQQLAVDKGHMTLVDEARQAAILDGLADHLVHAKRTSGGSACNSVVAAAYFGAKGFYSCKIANDENGDIFLADLAAAGVDSNFSANPRPDGITGKCLVLITPDAERSMNTFLGISETLSPAELDEQAIADSEYVYIESYLVTSPTGKAAAIRAREVAEAAGSKTALSFSDPGMVEFFAEGIREMLGDGVDLVFCNEEEALTFAGTESMDEAIAAIKGVARQFAITRGSKGALLFDGEALIEIDAHPVKAVDTNGAGDMFAGAFLYGLSQGWDFAKAGRLASRAAGEVVSDYGPRLPPAQHQKVLASLG